MGFLGVRNGLCFWHGVPGIARRIVLFDSFGGVQYRHNAYKVVYMWEWHY